MDIKVGAVYRYNGYNWGNDEESRMYKVVSISSNGDPFCLHLSSGNSVKVSVGFWDRGEMDLKGEFGYSPVLSRIRTLHNRQSNKHKFFLKEYPA